MSERIIHCTKLDQDLPGLAYAPMPGALGERIYASISKQAWQAWVKHSTMVMNEYRLNPADPADQETLLKQMEAFLFGGGEVAHVPGYVPPETCS